MTKRKVMLRTPKDVIPVSLINSLTCFFVALNQIGATSPNSFLPLFALQKTALEKSTLRSFDRFSNAKRDVRRNVPFCRLLSFSL